MMIKPLGPALPPSTAPSALPKHFYSCGSPSYIIFLLAHHMPMPCQQREVSSRFQQFLGSDSFKYILSHFCSWHIIRSIRIYATSNLFSCAYVGADVFYPHSYCHIHLSFDLHIHFSLSHNTPSTVSLFFHPLCTLYE